MAEELTIDTSKLTRTAVQFGKGMTAFLDTEMEYIQYLRNRGGIMGVGSGARGRRSLLQLDYAKKFHHPDNKFTFSPTRFRNVKPPKPGFWQNKLNKFNQTRMNRKIWNQLRKLRLTPNQIEVYKRLQPQIGSQRALEQARNIKPKGNWLTNTVEYFRKGFQRPDFLTRKNWGFLRPGVRDRIGDFLTKRPMGVGNNKTLQPRFQLPSWVKLPKWAANMSEGTKNWFKNLKLKFPKMSMPKGMKIPKVGTGGALTAITLIPTAVKVFDLFSKRKWKDASRLIIKTGVGMATFSLIFGASGAAAVLQAVFSGGTLTPTAILTLAGGTVLATGGSVAAAEGTDKFLRMIGLEDQPKTEKNSTGAVITSPTRGILGGTKALVGEANEAEIILPMSKIGDAISAVYREGASIMVGATLAFLGPLAGGPAVASLLGEAKRIGQQVGADTDIRVSTIKLPETLPAIHSNKVNNKEDVSEDTEFTSNKTDGQPSEGSHVSTVNRTSEIITGTDRWKTILPQGDPLFSSPFGMRWGRMHRGIDIGVWENSPVHAQEGGVVEQIIPKFGEYGGAVVIAHQDGTANLYGHVYDYVVKPGQKVEKGDPLAKIIYYPGSDGSNQSHLHFERFNKSGTRIDPLPYFQQGGASIDAQTDATITPVNQGGPNRRDISSSFVNMGSTVFNKNKQELIDTPVNATNVGNTNNTAVPIPIPYAVPVVTNKYIAVPEESNKETKMVIDVFGKGASRS